MKLSKECIEAIITNCNTVTDSKCRDFSKAAMVDALTNPSIYEKAGLMQTDGLLPESFNNEKVLTLLAISLRHLNAEQLANLLKSITQRSKEATTKAGLISLEDALGFAEWAQYEGKRINGDWKLGKEYYTTAQLFQIYQEQKNKP